MFLPHDYKVVYGLTWNDRWGAIEVDVNPLLTILGGVSLSDYGKEGKILNLDPCVEKEFDKYLRNEKHSINTSPGGGVAPGGSPGTGGGYPWPGGGGGDGWDNQQCEKHYYWKDGTLAFTVLVPC